MISVTRKSSHCRMAVSSSCGRARQRRIRSGYPPSAGASIPAGQALGLSSSWGGVRGRRAVTVQGESLVVAWFADQGLTIGHFSLDGALRESRVVADSDILGGLAIAATPQGEVGVIWDEFTDTPILGRRFRTDAEPAGPSFVVAEWDEGNKYPHGPRVAAGPDGSFVVVWWAEGSNALLGQRIDAEDRPVGERFPAGEPPGHLGDLGSLEICADKASGEFVVAWSAGYKPPQFRRYTAAAEPVTGALCTGLEGKVSCLPHERFVAVGQVLVPSGITRLPFLAARAFDGENHLIGQVQLPLQEIQPGLRATTSSVAALGEDTIIVAWHEGVEEDEPGCDVFAQRFELSPDKECPGDCDGDGRVSIDELVTALDLALHGKSGTVGERCVAVDADLDCRVSITDLVRAINNALEGCE